MQTGNSEVRHHVFKFCFPLTCRHKTDILTHTVVLHNGVLIVKVGDKKVGSKRIKTCQSVATGMFNKSKQ